MKRATAVKMMYPIGCLLVFRGEDWLDDLQDQRGIVVSHDDMGSGYDSFQVLVSGRILDILCDEFEDHEIELIDE